MYCTPGTYICRGGSYASSAAASPCCHCDRISLDPVCLVWQREIVRECDKLEVHYDSLRVHVPVVRTRGQVDALRWSNSTQRKRRLRKTGKRAVVSGPIVFGV